MEFSHIEDDTIYIKGTEQEKTDIILLMNSFLKEYEPHTHTYTNYDADEIKNVKIEVLDELLVIAKSDFKIIYGCFTGMYSVGFYGDSLSLNKQKFMEIDACFDDIREKLIGSNN